MWGIVPAAGSGSRIQPLAFSKELLPVGGAERPRAVSEYLLERMVIAGADKICVIISPWKSDIPRYYGSNYGRANLAYAIQSEPLGLCDAIFRALPFIGPDEQALIGLPDTIWFPDHALRALPDGELSFLLFPVDHPEFFDTVLTEHDGRVREIQVKSPAPAGNWIWGAFKLPGCILAALHDLWRARNRADQYIGTLVNAWLDAGGRAFGVPTGTSYVDVGTLHGYREAMRVLEAKETAA
jgi:glucose-1-phosphate thymidylyltransferase